MDTDDGHLLLRAIGSGLSDAGERFDYQRLDQAFGLLMAGAPLLAVGMNRYFKQSDGLHLDAGVFDDVFAVVSHCAK